MTFNELKKILEKYPFLTEKKYIYIDLRRFGRNYEKFGDYILVRDIFGKFCVQHNLDYEYGRIKDRKEFEDIDLAVNYLWEIFGGENKLKKLIDKYK